MVVVGIVVAVYCLVVGVAYAVGGKRVVAAAVVRRATLERGWDRATAAPATSRSAS